MRALSIITVLAIATALGACAGDQAGGLLTTQAVNPPKPIAEPGAVKVDASCSPLAARIEQLRQDAAVQRLEKASSGKTKTVAVKRASLAQQAELNKANHEFQSKCMGPGARPSTASAAAPAAQATAQPQAPAAKATAAKAPAAKKS